MWAEVLIGNSSRVQNLGKQEGNLETLNTFEKNYEKMKKIRKTKIKMLKHAKIDLFQKSSYFLKVCVVFLLLCFRELFFTGFTAGSSTQILAPKIATPVSLFTSAKGFSSYY